jgi:hypothetical protein
MTNPARGFKPCPNNPGVLADAGLQELTSGYFFGIFGKDDSKLPTGKCYHGYEGFPKKENHAGINKDEPNRPKPCHYLQHSKARDLAKEASIDFVNQILYDPRVTDDVEAIKVLMDIPPISRTSIPYLNEVIAE